MSLVGSENVKATILSPTVEQLESNLATAQSLLVTPKSESHEIIGYSPIDYKIEHLPPDELAGIISAAHGDARLFESFLGLRRFLLSCRYHSLGPEEDAVKLYDSYLGDIKKRLGQLGIDDI